MESPEPETPRVAEDDEKPALPFSSSDSPGKDDADSSSSPVDVPEDMLKTYFFGWGPCRPKWAQYVFARRVFFTILLCLYILLQSGIVSGLVSTILSSLQRRYNFTSVAVSIIPIVYDLTVLIGVIFISYFFRDSHRPRLLGCGILLLAFGSFLFAMPQFFFGRYQVGSDGELLEEACLDERGSAVESCNPSNIGAYAIFIISSIIIGVASTPIHTLGTAFIDEIVFPRYVSLHIGAATLTVVCAPVLGYGLGSAFLTTFVDPWVSTSLTPSDPAWVGAWWAPFLLFTVFLVLLSIPFLMYPRYLSDSHLVKQERAKEMAKVYSKKYANENSITIQFKMFPVQIKRLLLNPSFVFMMAGLAVSGIFLQGVVTFGPLFYEEQFNLPAATSGVLVGAISITGGFCGVLTGALVVFGCKLRGKMNALIVASLAVAVIPLLLIFLLHCPQTNVVGINLPYTDGSQTIDASLLDPCARMCNCTSNIFEPVCGADGQNYFSPCRAGCDKVVESDGSFLFENCTCIAASMFNDSTMIANATASNGVCSSQCAAALLPSLLGLIVLSYLTFFVALPLTIFMLRVVADDQRALALSVQSAVGRLFGAIPGPFIFGVFIDAACISRQTECGRDGRCWLYDKNQLSYSAIGMAIPGTAIAAVLYFLAWLTYPKPKPKEEKEEVELT